jgi:cytochrome subunit of sulfide dehydrogenase
MTDKSAFTCFLIALAFVLLPSIAAAQDASRLAPTPYLTGTCTNCHGTQGRSASAMPSLAGLSQPYFVEQMKQFREGKRPATIMHQIAKGYTDQQTDMLAEYFARQTPAR